MIKKGMIFLIAIGAFSFNLAGFSKYTKDPFEKEIKWNKDLKMNWSWFKASVPENHKNSKFSAETFSTIKTKTPFKNSNYAIESFYCVFNTDRSWKKSNVDSALLAHERIHWDITELITRKTKSNLHNKKFINWNAYVDYYILLSDKLDKTRISLNAQFDKECNYGLNHKEQIRWRKKVDSLLLSYSKFEADTIRVWFTGK